MTFELYSEKSIWLIIFVSCRIDEKYEIVNRFINRWFLEPLRTNCITFLN